MKSLCIIFINLLLSLSLNAQYINWENITNTNKVTSLCDDGDTLWIGTYGGLVKYDKKTGTSFNYNKANAGLPTNCINDLGFDSKHNLWIAGQYNGLGCFINGKCTIFNGLSTSIITDSYCKGIYIDKNDTVFVGALKKFYHIFNNQIKSNSAYNPVLSLFQYINDIEPSSDSSLILATTYGLCKYKKGNYSLKLYNNRLNCNAAKFDQSGNLWVATENNGLYKYKNDSLTTYNSENSVCPNKITSCIVDKYNNIWIASGSLLINFKESGNSEIYNLNFTNERINTMTIDNNCIWIGTNQHGLYKFINGQFSQIQIINPESPENGQLEILSSKLLMGGMQYNGKSFTTLFDTLTGLKTNPLNGLKILKNKGVFTFGDKTTLGYFENNSWRYYDQFTTDYLKNIVPVSPDTFWVSTSNRGLLKYENGQVHEYNSTNSPLPNNSLYALTFDKNKVLWGSFGYSSGISGIFSFDGINWKIYTTSDNSYLSNKIMVMKFDSQNNLWCSSSSNSAVGILRYDGINWTNYLTSNSDIPSNFLNNIYIDNTDTVWVATRDAGAAKFDKGNKWQTYSMSNSGLVDDITNDIVRMSNGDVYFSHSSGGLSVLKSPNSFNGIIHPYDSFAKLKIFPVPAKNILCVKIPENCVANKIEIFDMTSKIIYSSAIVNQLNDLLTIDISAFPKGVYLLKLKTEENNYSQKVIIN